MVLKSAVPLPKCAETSEGNLKSEEKIVVMYSTPCLNKIP
jgi:hypothetical protein